MQRLLTKFKATLNARYMHLAEETASFAYEFTGRYGVKGLCIYFEKSNGATDWKNNFDFPAKPYRDMEDKWYAHRGFLKVWKVIEPHLKDAIMSPDIKFKRSAATATVLPLPFSVTNTANTTVPISACGDMDSVRTRIAFRELYRDNKYAEQLTGQNVEDAATVKALLEIGVDIRAWEREEIHYDKDTGEVTFNERT